MLPMRSDLTIEVETRLPERVLRDLVKLGAKLKPLPPFDFHMGSFQQAWRDSKTGLLNASSDPLGGRDPYSSSKACTASAYDSRDGWKSGIVRWKSS